MSPTGSKEGGITRLKQKTKRARFADPATAIAWSTTRSLPLSAHKCQRMALTTREFGKASRSPTGPWSLTNQGTHTDHSHRKTPDGATKTPGRGIRKRPIPCRKTPTYRIDENPQPGDAGTQIDHPRRNQIDRKLQTEDANGQTDHFRNKNAC